METVTTIEKVMTFETKTGNTRYVVKDSSGNEYTTFRESIGQEAQRLEGSRARPSACAQHRGVSGLPAGGGMSPPGARLSRRRPPAGS